MKERSILFSAPMVRALLDGSKTQTRRVMKPQPVRPRDGTTLQWNDAPLEPDSLPAPHCPYGEPSDRLWVRETFFAYGRWETRYNGKKERDEWRFVDMTIACGRAYQYAADNPGLALANGRALLPGWHKRPAIHMPRIASRITLDVTGVRAEQLQGISHHDAIAEGIRRGGEDTRSPRQSYQELWESINGAGSWDANPWVWVVEFRRLMPAPG